MRPLEGTLVVDLTHLWAGPFCTQTLADLGAEVIKIEPPTGDRTRHAPGAQEGLSPVFLSVNRNKQGVCLDLRKPQGREVLLRLVRQADVLVHNFRPPVAERLGLSYPVLRPVNPRLILASISGYGDRGPYQEWPGQDLLLQAFSGLLSITGYEGDQRPTAPVGVAIVDAVTGLVLALGVLTALYQRERTGEGREVKTSLLAGALALQGNVLGPYLVTGALPPKAENAHPYLPPPFGVWRTAEGREIALSPLDEEAWRAFCSVVGHPEWAQDPRFATRESRRTHRQALASLVQSALATRPLEEWLRLFQEADVWVAPALTYREMLATGQPEAAGLLVSVPHPAGGLFSALGPPFPLEEGLPPPTPPPRLGEHTRSVLRRLGYSEEEVHDLYRLEAVR